MAAYQVLTFDLATVRDRELIQSTRNNAVATVAIVQLPAGAGVSIHFGQGGNGIPLLNQGMEFQPCPPERDGVYLSNPAGAGNLVLLVSYEGGRIGSGVNQ